MPRAWPVFFESDQAYRLRPGFGIETAVVVPLSAQEHPAERLAARRGVPEGSGERRLVPGGQGIRRHLRHPDRLPRRNRARPSSCSSTGCSTGPRRRAGGADGDDRTRNVEPVTPFRCCTRLAGAGWRREPAQRAGHAVLLATWKDGEIRETFDSSARVSQVFVAVLPCRVAHGSLTVVLSARWPGRTRTKPLTEFEIRADVGLAGQPQLHPAADARVHAGSRDRRRARDRVVRAAADPADRRRIGDRHRHGHAVARRVDPVAARAGRQRRDLRLPMTFTRRATGSPPEVRRSRPGPARVRLNLADDTSGGGTPPASPTAIRAREISSREAVWPAWAAWRRSTRA